MSHLNGKLIIASKHALYSPHTLKATEWLHVHLKRANRTEAELVSFLQKHNLTAVFEMADDDFEEHILEYPPERRGLYVHGLNSNSLDFHTLDFVFVVEFGQMFGFNLVNHFTLNTFLELQEYAAEASKTGTFRGEPIEGFVVRCKVENSPFFFKIKFDEPYLMFREWREVTCAMLQDKPFLKYKYAITAEYYQWLCQKHHFYPELFEKYLKKKGIIRIRNMFLSEVKKLTNFCGPTIVEMAKNVNPDFTPVADICNEEKILLVPIGSIGCGKTTVGLTLSKLLSSYAAIQNDNIQKGGGAMFTRELMNSFLQNSVVYADRNNHLFEHREKLCKTFKSYYPKGQVIALNWNIENLDKPKLLQMTIERVVNRGENHQSLTPNRTRNFKQVISNFIYRRSAFDTSKEPDSLFDGVLLMNISDPADAHITKLFEYFKWELPSATEIDAAIQSAMSMPVTTVKMITKRALPAYYGLKVTGTLKHVIKLILEKRPELGIVCEGDKQDYHITLAFRSSNNDPIVKSYDTLYAAKEKGKMGIFGQVFDVSCDTLVWNNRVAALLVSVDPLLSRTNEFPHITLAKLCDDAKAWESNNLLKQYHEKVGLESINVLEFPLVTIQTQFQEFWRTL